MSTKIPAFCYIAPTAFLEYTKASTSHLLLAHLVDCDPIYTAFYKERSSLGDFIMMDCSSYELHEPYAPDKLIDLGVQCGAHAIVLPDYPFQSGQVTIDAAIKYIPLFKSAGMKTFFVPQSKKGDIEDYIKTYVWASNNPDIDIIGCSILGMPNALPHIHPAYARVVLTQLLIDRGLFNFNKKHHYLGLNSGPNLEIPSLIRMNALDTVDSSGPIWAGILGHLYSEETDSLLSIKKPLTPVDFSLPMTTNDDILTAIETNINLTQSIFVGDNEVGVWYAEESNNDKG